MSQLLFYIEVQTFKADGTLFDVHQSQAGGLPIIYRNEKKARWQVSLMRNAFFAQGYQQTTPDAIPPYWFQHPSTGTKVHVCIREVRVLT